jgi:alpha-glucuronidase
VRKTLCLFTLWIGTVLARGEDGYELWLRYRPEADPARRDAYRQLAARVHVPPGSPVLAAAKDELARALPAITGVSLAWTERATATLMAAPGLLPAAELGTLGSEGFVLGEHEVGGRRAFIITGGNDVAVMRGVFEFLRRLQLGTSVAELAAHEPERLRERLANHWDNPVRTAGVRSESIERGYAGDSFFKWDELPGRIDPRLHDWARLLAAMSLNGVVVNNVNTAKRGLEGWRLLTTPWLPKLAAMAGVLRPYGVRLYVAVNFFSPVLIDGLPTADPLDPAVQKWWRAKADEIYAAIPDFGGFLVKADSEGEPGPMKYGRTHADGANLIAAALAPHGGRVHWRAFVYDRATGDRVTQAYSNFAPLDGRFADNAFVQIKNGPLDFQVREPVSPLFGAMPRTHELLELQITQEYTGQDKHVCFLAPLWQETLAFAPCGDSAPNVAQTIAGIAGVMNVGSARNWTGQLLAQANTYAFGRLAWNPALPPEQLAEEWVRLTFGRDPQVVATVSRLLLASRRTYENYTAPLGLGLLTRRSDHLAPDPANRADYHGGDAHGVGFDRTVATGTGFAGQYCEPWRSRYEQVATCPEDLLLFFHHLPYTQRLASGRTLIQEIYARHIAGVAQVRAFVRDWESLRGLIDDERYQQVLGQLRAQVTLAEQWRDTVNGYFEKLSGIPPVSAATQAP